jgi:hypothetical protein
MATRSEQAHAEEQRKNGSSKSRTRAGRSKPGAPPGTRTRAKKHAGRKATYALEATEAPEGGRPSRKSTRKSANRAKADAGLTGREQLVKGSPENRYAKGKSRATRVRGH